VVYVFPITPPFCEHSSIVYNVLNPSSLALKRSGHSHIDVFNDPAQHLMVIHLISVRMNFLTASILWGLLA